MQCDCGTVKLIAKSSILRGLTQSCGCLHAEQQRVLKRTHGQSATKLYNVWNGMRQRCDNPKDSRYADYGGRGIRVCARWRKFENFLADMGPRPPGTTLDRENNNGNYTPRNCKWADRKTQNRNTRQVVLIKFNGLALPKGAWAERLGTSKFAVHYHYRKYKTLARLVRA